MTVAELIAYYANLLIIQYKGKPKAYATVEATVKPMIMDLLPLAVQNAYDLETAVGVQLDVIGKYAGVKRSGYTFTGPVTLGDDDFRVLIRLAIIKNSAGSSLAEIQDLLNRYFPGQIFVFDFKNMRMGYYLSSSIASQDLAQMFITEGLLPVPMAVELASTIYFPILDAFFGFRTYSFPAYNASPFNDYDNYQLTYPWLSYSYEIGSPSNFDESLITENGFDTLVQEDGSALYI